MLRLLMLKECQAFGKWDRRARSTRLLLLSVEDLMMMVIPIIIIAGGSLQRGLLAHKPGMGSATGRVKVWNHLNLLSPEKTAAFKQPIKGLCLELTHLYFNNFRSLSKCDISPSSYCFLLFYYPSPCRLCSDVI